MNDKFANIIIQPTPLSSIKKNDVIMIDKNLCIIIGIIKKLSWKRDGPRVIINYTDVITKIKYSEIFPWYSSIEKVISYGENDS
jgi:translation elongation factor P/translation initiation factor 5A